jgi:serine O-acetyltransferase
LGPLLVGDHVQIGANAVVTKDVPSNSVAYGVPAVVKVAESRLSSGATSVLDNRHNGSRSV